MRPSFPPDNFAELVAIFVYYIALIIPLIFGLALLAFFIGLVKFIAKAGDAKSHEEGKALMKWGLIGLFVMLSLFGILRFAYGDIFGGGFGIPLLPES